MSDEESETSGADTVVYKNARHVVCHRVVRNTGKRVASIVDASGTRVLLSEFSLADKKRNPAFFRAARTETGRATFKIRQQAVGRTPLCTTATGPTPSDLRAETKEIRGTPTLPPSPRRGSAGRGAGETTGPGGGGGGGGGGSGESVLGAGLGAGSEAKGARRLRVGASELLALGAYQTPIQHCRAQLRDARSTLKETRLRVSTLHTSASELKTRLDAKTRALADQERHVTQLERRLAELEREVARGTLSDEAAALLRTQVARLQTQLDGAKAEAEAERLHANERRGPCATYGTLREARQLVTTIRELYPELVLPQNRDETARSVHSDRRLSVREGGSAAECGQGDVPSWRSSERERAFEADRRRVQWIKDHDVGQRILGFRILPPFLSDDSRRQQPRREGDEVGKGAYVGEGAHGIVFAVQDAREQTRLQMVALDKAPGEWAGVKRALKIVTSRRADTELSADMIVEGTLMRSLHHPNLMRAELIRTNTRRVPGDGNDGNDGETTAEGDEDALPTGMIGILMDFGFTFEQWQTSHPEEARDPAIVLRMAQEIHCGLGHLWRNGIAHQDVKPSNVLLVPRNGGPRAGTEPAENESLYQPVLSDFGAAKRFLRRQRLSVVKGTLELMPPERVLSERVLRGGNDSDSPLEPVDAISDTDNATPLPLELSFSSPTVPDGRTPPRSSAIASASRSLSSLSSRAPTRPEVESASKASPTGQKSGDKREDGGGERKGGVGEATRRASDFEDGFWPLVASDMWSFGCLVAWLMFGNVDAFAPTRADLRFKRSGQTDVPIRLVDRVLVYRNMERVLPRRNIPRFWTTYLDVNAAHMAAYLDDEEEHAVTRHDHVWETLLDLQTPLDAESGDERQEERAAARRAHALRLVAAHDTEVRRSRRTDPDAVLAAAARFMDNGAARAGLDAFFDGVFRWRAADRRVDFSAFERAPDFWATRVNGVAMAPLACRTSVELRLPSGAETKRAPTDYNGFPVARGKSGATGNTIDVTSTSYGPIVFVHKNIPGLGAPIVDKANEVYYRYLCGLTTRREYEVATRDVWLQLAAFLVACKMYNKTTRGYVIQKLRRGTPAIEGDLTPTEQDIYHKIEQWSTLTPYQRSLIYQRESLILATINWNADSTFYRCQALEDARDRLAIGVIA